MNKREFEKFWFEVRYDRVELMLTSIGGIVVYELIGWLVF